MKVDLTAWACSPLAAKAAPRVALRKFAGDVSRSGARVGGASSLQPAFREDLDFSKSRGSMYSMIDQSARNVADGSGIH